MSVQSEQNLGEYTEMEKMEVGAGLKNKLKFYIEEVQFEMPIGPPTGNVR